MAIFTSSQLKAISDLFDEMHSSFSKTCKLYFNPKFVTGNQNLLLSDTTYLANVGEHGGPIQSNQHNAGGSNLIQEDVTENVDLVIDWTIKDNQRWGAKVTVPFGIIHTRGYLTDLPKIQRCNEMQVDLPIQPIVNARYRWLGDGADIFSIVQGRFFLGYWERIS